MINTVESNSSKLPLYSKNYKKRSKKRKKKKSKGNFLIDPERFYIDKTGKLVKRKKEE